VLLHRKELEHKTMLGRLGTTEDMAVATAFLASDDAFLYNRRDMFLLVSISIFF